MRVEIKLISGTRMEREIPYDDMFAFTQEILHRNSSNWLLIGGTAIPVAQIEFIKPAPVSSANESSTQGAKRPIGFVADEETGA